MIYKILIFSTLIATTAVQACPLGMKAHNDGGRHTEKMVELLQLDDQRAEQLRQIHADSRAQFQKMFDATREERREFARSRHTQVEALLTENELAILREHRKQRAEQWRTERRQQSTQ